MLETAAKMPLGCTRTLVGDTIGGDCDLFMLVLSLTLSPPSLSLF